MDPNLMAGIAQKSLSLIFIVVPKVKRGGGGGGGKMKIHYLPS